VGPVASQTTVPVSKEIAKGLAEGRSGNFKGVVVSCNADDQSCVVKTKNGNKTGYMTYASYNGGFNAAKELQAGDNIEGQWQEYRGKIYATIVVKED
jgi:hypothetical protein